MKKITLKWLPALLTPLLMFAAGCQPNGDNNSTDTDNELREAGNDSTRYPHAGIDSTDTIGY